MLNEPERREARLDKDSIVSCRYTHGIPTLYANATYDAALVTYAPLDNRISCDGHRFYFIDKDTVVSLVSLSSCASIACCGASDLCGEYIRCRPTDNNPSARKLINYLFHIMHVQVRHGK